MNAFSNWRFNCFCNTRRLRSKSAELKPPARQLVPSCSLVQPEAASSCMRKALAPLRFLKLPAQAACRHFTFIARSREHLEKPRAATSLTCALKERPNS